MKHLFRQYLIDTVSLFIASQIATGIFFEIKPNSLLLAGVGLTLASLLVKPMINVLLVPINLITFGLFKWVSSAIALYIVTLVVPGFKIMAFNYPGFESRWIDIPSISLGGFLAFVAFSFVLSFIASFFKWVCK